ncbi:hypothetical protein QWJ41_06815 [Nocardioides sp. SOB44]|uniref:Protocatechuate 3,4-dioxygenase beta subunit N-terminal domain-containing protein n=1 Tax=Nocardioides cremeus TaxID=3058044 RepID=A0ABT8TN84_9ACTN|nr:hypothetical protein [Nocardioides cremeus]MDO3395421.1 hypothetical protein [Nocardioides cremeus]
MSQVTPPVASSDAAATSQAEVSAEIAALAADYEADGGLAGPGEQQPRLDYPPYRSSLLRHPTKDLTLSSQVSVPLKSFGSHPAMLLSSIVFSCPLEVGSTQHDLQSDGSCLNRPFPIPARRPFRTGTHAGGRRKDTHAVRRRSCFCGRIKGVRVDGCESFTGPRRA